MKHLTALLLAFGVAAAAPCAHAETAVPAKKIHARKTPSKADATHKSEAAAEEDDREPDIAASVTTEYQCELGNRLTIFRNADDNDHIAMRWKKQLLRLTRVDTTTGANRFENRKNGWVWIDIPAKGMLLDAKKGQQLANECMHPEQTASKPAEPGKK